jgi:glycosyltransferase involved in cell wall biosynthesis
MLPLKVVVLSDWLAEKMGYTENLLPRALARQGAEVHLVTSDLQPALPNYAETYEPFLGPRQQQPGQRTMDGFAVHRLPHGSQKRGVYLKGLGRKLHHLKPDVVQALTIWSLSTYQSAVWKPVLGYALFLEEHIHQSVFHPNRRTKLWLATFRRTLGPAIGSASERCYPIASDVARIAVEEFGYPESKISICPLGVDTDVFFPVQRERDRIQREELRSQLGFAKDDVVCVYSGRFNPAKDPQCLATAVEHLNRETGAVRGLFIGSGTEAEIREISSRDGCATHPFVDSSLLADFYRACDIGVWPRQESTSQLDAAACGLPIVISDRVTARERVEGNGMTYREGDARNLAQVVRSLIDPRRRQALGEAGARKVRERFNWDSIAAERMSEYLRVIS